MCCTSCGFENAYGMSFCGKCASPLIPRRPNCRFENPPEHVFCGKGSVRLRAQSSTPQPQPPARTPPAPRNYTPPHRIERILAERGAFEAR